MDIWKLLNLKRNNEIIYLLLLNLIMIISINKKNIFQKKLNIKYETKFNKKSRKRRKNRKSLSLPSYTSLYWRWIKHKQYNTNRIYRSKNQFNHK